MRHNHARTGRDGRSPAGQYAAYQAAQEFAASQQGRPYVFGGQPPDDYGYSGYPTEPRPVITPGRPGPAYQARYPEPEPEPARGKGEPAPTTGATVRITLCLGALAACAIVAPVTRLPVAVFLAIVATWALWSRLHWSRQRPQQDPADDWAALSGRAGYGPRR
jgi:hypothetical protein